jgi:hypothetical protein
MDNYRSVIPFLIRTAKEKGVWSQETHLDNENTERMNDHIVIFRGSTMKTFDCLFERGKSRFSAH